MKFQDHLDKALVPFWTTVEGAAGTDALRNGFQIGKWLVRESDDAGFLRGLILQLHHLGTRKKVTISIEMTVRGAKALFLWDGDVSGSAALPMQGLDATKVAKVLNTAFEEAAAKINSNKL